MGKGGPGCHGSGSEARPPHRLLKGRTGTMLSPTTYRIHSLACWLLIGMGITHASGTLVDLFHPTFFGPTDAQVQADLRTTPVALGTWLRAEGMTVWSGNLGWNLNMSL